MKEIVYASFTSVLAHASASITVERRHSCRVRTCTSVKCNPVGTSNSVSTTPPEAFPPKSRNCPPNPPFRIAPIPNNTLLSTHTRDPNSNELSKFDCCAVIPRVCTKLVGIESGPMVKEVVDCGNGVQNGSRKSNIPSPNKITLSTFVNHGVYSKNFSGILLCPPIEKRRSLTWWAGLSSGTGNASIHLTILFGVKWVV